MSLPPSLQRLVRAEHDLHHVSRALATFARDLQPSVVGAVQVNCSDESEREVMEAFQREFTEPLLPELRYWSRSAFRTINLGARYEAGAIGIAESHFATPRAEEGPKLIVVKLNSHVSRVIANDGVHYGNMPRYDRECVYCGALSALIQGVQAPFTRELAATLAPERVQWLREAADPDTRALAAAVLNARLQSERALAEIAQLRPLSPTRWLVASCVTINQPKVDTELLCALTLVEPEGARRTEGVGVDPRAYRFTDARSGAIQVLDAEG
ncbi:MAG: hypothetical protein H6741_08115 [Alphaproteobacteria bacterium]|nr:hypothetical protein [Alphaproteobacteria bacterium]